MTQIDVGVQLLIAFIVLLFSLSVHEAAHAWTADRLGDPTARMLGRVSLNPIVHIDPIGTVVLPLMSYFTNLPLLGWAKPVPVVIRNLKRPRLDHLLVAAAGPFSNLLLAIMASIVLRIVLAGPSELGQLSVQTPLLRLADQALKLNILLAVFNMIPVPPLDGGAVLGNLLPRSAAYQFERLRPYGIFVLYALMLTGALWTLISPPFALLLSLLRP